jgi:ATP-binding cassette subfamily B protein
MSRLVETHQERNHQHYQSLPLSFTADSTGDLMSRISEDVGRVRIHRPAIIYLMQLKGCSCSSCRLC